MRKIILLVFVMAALQGCSNTTVASIRDSEVSPEPPAQTDSVQIVSGKFSPSSIITAKGHGVQIKNLDSKSYTIISDPHPTHDLIPALYEIIYKNETKTLNIEKSGEFGAHLEENPSVQLKIIVVD